MKNLLVFTLLIFASFFSGSVYADFTTKDDALQIAKRFYLTMAGDKANVPPEDLIVKLIDTRNSGGIELIYVYNLNDKGYLLLSAWDGTQPVLAFSFENSVDLSSGDLPSGFNEILAVYEAEILYAIDHDLAATPEISAQWVRWLKPANTAMDGRSVNPLLSTSWNQSCYYNALCPEDENAPYGYCGHVPAGCVALAMAQLMKFWNYPSTGIGSHAYYAYPYGTQSADFGNTTYQWDNMPNSIGSSNIDLATLIYHCAVSVDMQFSPAGSGASTSTARNALVNYFDYDQGAQFYFKDNYPDTGWESMLRNELDLGRPLIYRGEGNGGHAWVCDGYAADNYFHMNWGWGGYANGYFYLSNLNPAGADFSSNQAAIMGLLPAGEVLDPPGNLEAQVSENDVLLTWDAPFEPRWIHWDDGVSIGTLSLSGGGSFYAAACWNPSDLELYQDAFITKVSAFFGSNEPVYVLKIWKGENAPSLIYSQALEAVGEYSWNTINLDNPLQIDASEALYIGFSIIDQPNGAGTLGYDSGPAVDGKGDLISFGGESWNELQYQGIDVNWNIHAFVAAGNENKSVASTHEISIEKLSTDNTSFELIPHKQVSGAKAPWNKGLLGYNIYRDGQKINDTPVSETSFLDQDLPAGIFEYFLTAVYNAGESGPGNTVTATISLLTRNLVLESGWNSISSDILPLNCDIELMCNPIMDDLIILQDLNNFYYPAQNHNTIGDWDIGTGYLIKVAENCQLPVQGYALENRTLTLNNGWNLMPVLSDCEVNTADLFSAIAAYVRIVKDASGTGVYWPSVGVNSLPSLVPGKAYYVKIFGTKTITFPPCDE